MTHWNSCRASTKHTRAHLKACDLVNETEGETDLTEADIDAMDEYDLYEWLEVGWDLHWNQERGTWHVENSTG